MSAHVTNQDQFRGSLPRIMPPDIPPEYGTQPIPEGMIRFNHYTRDSESGQAIKREGILRSKGEESFAHGGTESPQVFMTAGKASPDLLRSRTVVEGYANPERGGDLDVGENWQGRSPQEHVAHVEGNKSVITARGDIPASQILGVHEPWHETSRMLGSSPEHEKNIVAGNFDDIEPTMDQALPTAKTALAAKVLLGGALQGEQWK
jgi:hypothetical protein